MGACRIYLICTSGLDIDTDLTMFKQSPASMGQYLVIMTGLVANDFSRHLDWSIFTWLPKLGYWVTEKLRYSKT